LGRYRVILGVLPVSERPYVLVSCAMSVDGYIDDRGPDRLILSGREDQDRVDEVRAGCDAIMVGAATVRRDNPRLVIRSDARRAARVARGLPENPIKITVTGTGDLPPEAAFFTVGSAPRLVYCARAGLGVARARLSALAEVVDAGEAPSPALILNDLTERPVGKVLLEGGGRLASSFLLAGLVDELHLVVAPFFVGDPAAPRFGGPGVYPHDPGHRMQLAEVRQVGDVVLLRYLLDVRVPEPEIPRTAQRPGAAGHAETRAAAKSAIAEHIRWLRQTIAMLSEEEATVDPPPGPWPAPNGEPPGSRPALADPVQASTVQGGTVQGGTVQGGTDQGGTDQGGAVQGGADHWAADEGAADCNGADHGGTNRGGASTMSVNEAANVDVHWLRETIELARRCPPSATAFSVGAIIVGADGMLLATGFSRERDLRDHAEEVALAKIAPGDPRLARATIYSSLEPCGARASRPRPCADLIIAAGIPRVVYAWHEPPLLASGGGAEMLTAAGVSVIEIPELAPEARAINAHLIHADPS
jgi:5-amino-6-(5-phosphoribosylamino)uracil reductase